MSLNLNNQKKGGGGVPQDIIEVGTYPARLARVIDLGIQTQNAFEGQEKPPAHMVDFTYEMLDVFMKDKDGNEDESKPRWVSESFPIHHPSADLAKSTKRAKALDPNDDFDFDLTKMVGAPCMVTIVHKKSKGKTYANIGSVSVMRAKDVEKAPELKNETTVFSLDDPDLATFNKFPDWLKDKITSNLEFKGSKLAKMLNGVVDELTDAEDNDQAEREEW